MASHGAGAGAAGMSRLQTDLRKLTKLGRDGLTALGEALATRGRGAAAARRPVFGRSLEEFRPAELMEGVPLPVYRCVEFLARTEGFAENGIFRISAVQSEVRSLKALYDKGDDPNLLAMFGEPHTASALLKLYFRELPEPLLTFELYDCFFAANGICFDEPRLECIKKILHFLPPANFTLVVYIVRFLRLVAAASDRNRMTPANLATVFAPNLLRSENDASFVSDASQASQIMQTLIEDYEFLLGDAGVGRYDFEYLAAGETPPPSLGPLEVEHDDADAPEEPAPLPPPVKPAREPPKAAAAASSNGRAALSSSSPSPSPSPASTPTSPGKAPPGAAAAPPKKPPRTDLIAKAGTEVAAMPAPPPPPKAPRPTVTSGPSSSSSPSSNGSNGSISSGGVRPKVNKPLPPPPPSDTDGQLPPRSTSDGATGIVRSPSDNSPAKLPAPGRVVLPTIAARPSDSEAGEGASEAPWKSRSLRPVQAAPIEPGLRPMSMFNPPVRRVPREEISTLTSQFNRLSMALAAELDQHGTIGGKPPAPARRRPVPIVSLDDEDIAPPASQPSQPHSATGAAGPPLKPRRVFPPAT